MELIINSRILGKKLTFSRPGAYYIFVDLNGEAGSLGFQICRRGRLAGGTIGYSGGDTGRFEAICRRWYRAHVALERS